MYLICTVLTLWLYVVIRNEWTIRLRVEVAVNHPEQLAQLPSWYTLMLKAWVWSPQGFGLARIDSRFWR